MNIEEIKDRVNKTKNAFHKLGIEGQVNINVMLNDIEFLLKEIEELKAENKEIREWKYVIDNPIDLKKLSELDLIKIFGKSYISEDKIKSKIEECEKEKNIIPSEMDFEAFYRIKDLKNVEIGVLQSLLEKE